MRAKSYKEVREEIENFNKELAEAVFHGQIEVYYIEKFENQYALIKKLEEESSSMLNDAGNPNMTFNPDEYLEKQRLIKDLQSRKNELTGSFYPLIKGRVVKIFRGHEKLVIGDELSFNLRANFASFIATGDDNPPWEYEVLSKSKFMELLVKDNFLSEQPNKLRSPSLSTELNQPTEAPIFKKTVSEAHAKLNKPEMIERVNQSIASAGLHIQIEIAEKLNAKDTEIITGRVIRIFDNEENVQIGDEIYFEQQTYFDEKKYMELVFDKEKTFIESKSPREIDPFITRIIEKPTDRPLLVRQDPPKPPIFNENVLFPESSQPLECTRCGHLLLANTKFCGRCGLQVSHIQGIQMSLSLICPSCGLKNFNDSNFCRICGMKLRDF